MRCKHCNARLAAHDIWCVECGKQSQVVKNELSAMKSLAETYKSLRPSISSAIPGTAFALILGLIPVLVLIVLFSTIISLESRTAVEMLRNLAIKSVAFSVFVPLILIAFKAVCKHSDYRLSFRDMIDSLRSYPKYLWFTIISALFYSFIYLICFGLPNFGSLPILRLVWLVLVNYWVAIALPAVVLMEQFNWSPWFAIKKSYKHFHDLRWNIFLLALVLTFANLIALGLFFFLLIPLVFTLSLSLFAIRDYVRRLVDFELLDYRR